MLKATIYLCIISLIIYFIDTLSYSLRLVIYRNRQYSLTGSTFSVITVVTKFATTFQIPLYGVLTDVSIINDKNPINDFRLVLVFASLGVIAAIVLLPAFIVLFTRFVNKVSKEGSVFKGLRLSKDEISSLKSFRIKLPKLSMLKGLKIFNKNKSLWFLYLIVFSIYTIGVISAYYAAIWMPEARLSIAGFSGTVNSVATVLSLLILEPKIAIVTDEVYKGNLDYLEIKSIVVIMVITKLLGTIIGQVLLIPAAKWILFIYKLLVGIV